MSNNLTGSLPPMPPNGQYYGFAFVDGMIMVAKGA
jgi:hypothetical protein